MRLRFAQLIAQREKAQREVMSAKRSYLSIVCWGMITSWLIKKSISLWLPLDPQSKESPETRELLTMWLAANGHGLCEWHDALITVIAKQPVMLWCPLPLSSHSTPCPLCVCWGSERQLSDACSCINQSLISQKPESAFNFGLISAIIEKQRPPPTLSPSNSCYTSDLLFAKD